MIKIGSIGYNCTHPSSFCVDWKSGPGAYILLLVKTPAFFRLGKNEFEVKPGTAVVISPGTPTYYRPLGRKYTDDWFYFDAPDEDIKALSDLGIMIDFPSYIGPIDSLSTMIYEMTAEFYGAEPFHEEIAFCLTEVFFRRLARAIANGSGDLLGISDGKRAELNALRSRIYRDPASLPAISDLAEEMKISLSSLEHLYKKAFGTPIIADIVNSRVDCSKRLLLSTKLSLSEVAEQSGYNTTCTFMRQFKRKVGVTPSTFRRLADCGEWNPSSDMEPKQK